MAERTIGALLLGVLGGCLSPPAMHRAVLEYDRTVNRVETELLLLNIARARHHHPIHFTAISGIAATFEFRASGGIGGELGHDSPDVLSLSLAGSASENPTVSIVPVQGEEFTKRLLTPLDETRFEFLFHQGVDPAILLRLMARGLLVEGEGEPALALNDPDRPDAYTEFRRRVLHLSRLDAVQSLHVGPIEASAGGENGGSRIAITNVDPGRLPPEERRRLAARAAGMPRNQVLVEIRPEGTGGDLPFRGAFVLRNFKAILTFLGRSIADRPEFPVDPDPRTGPVPRNPARTLEIRETRGRPGDTVFAAEERGFWYSIGDGASAAEAEWNREGFDLLYQLYQLTVTEVKAGPLPMITIAK